MAASIATGREGIVRKGKGQFYYCLGDITLNGEKIKFTEYPQDLLLTSLEQLNQYTMTKPMQANDQSLLDYSVMYGFLDSAAAVAAFTGEDYVRFKVMLVDAETNQILGEYDNVLYSQANALRYNNIAYQLALQGAGNRTVRLALKVE
jgi:hypothetical protein